MAKITRKIAKVFGLSSGVSEIAQFGSLAAGSPAFSTDPTVIQALSNWLGGWFQGVEGANSPAIEDMNAFCYVMAYQVAYLLQTGVGEWDATTTYYIGSLVNDGTGVLYRSLTDSNLNNALSSSANWANAFVAGGIQRTVTASDTFLASDQTVIMNNTGGTAQETLPATATTAVGKRLTLIRAATSTFLAQIKGNASENIFSQLGTSNTFDLPDAGDSVTVENTGSGWYVI